MHSRKPQGGSQKFTLSEVEGSKVLSVVFKSWRLEYCYRNAKGERIYTNEVRLRGLRECLKSFACASLYLYLPSSLAGRGWGGVVDCGNRK